jgi:hypothetical protein
MLRHFPLFVTCLLIAAGATAADLPANLVTNPSLEEPVGPTGLPPGWGSFYSNPAGAYQATVADGGRTGKKEMRIEIVAQPDEAQFGAMPANRVPLDPTKRYVARGWIKVTGGKRATADVKLHYYAEGGAYLGQTRVGFASPGSDEWQLVTVTDRAANFPQAKLIGLAIACTGDATARYDNLELLAFDKANLPADFESTYGVTLSPQLAVLGRRVGTWTTAIRIKPCLSVPQGLESTGTETVRWTVGGQLLEARSLSSDGVEQLSLMTFDARDRVYRSWFFGTNGNIPRGQTIGKWDATTEVLTFENQPQDEFDSVFRIKLIGNDEVRWQGVTKDKDGRILLDAQGSARRKLPD